MLSHSRGFSTAAKQNLKRYLKDGGDLVLLGGTGFTEPDSMLLPAFSRYEPYVLKDIVSIRAEADQNLLPPMKVSGQVRRTFRSSLQSRVGEVHPAASAIDADGRTKGWAAGLLTHFDEYKGSNWLLFGISNPEFYRSSYSPRPYGPCCKMKSGELERTAGLSTKPGFALESS